MTSKQRAYLKGLAMNIEPVFQVGKSGLTPEITEAVLEAFNTRELIKLAVLKNCLIFPVLSPACIPVQIPPSGILAQPD